MNLAKNSTAIFATLLCHIYMFRNFFNYKISNQLYFFELFAETCHMLNVRHFISIVGRAWSAWATRYKRKIRIGRSARVKWKSGMVFLKNLFVNTIFVSSHMYLENHEGTHVIIGSMDMGYISDTARNRTHNLFRPKREPHH